MNVFLAVCTVLGGISAVWFLYEKRTAIVGWFKRSPQSGINPLSLPDEEFMFLHRPRENFLSGPYLPTSQEEQVLCKSLTNSGVLKPARRNMFALTRHGKKLLRSENA